MMKTYKKTRSVFFCVAALILFVLLEGKIEAQIMIEPRLIRTPAIHGDTIVFSYAGDLWVTKAGAPTVARRLTSHPRSESRPRISPDGRMVAFNGSFDGPSEIYLVPIEGGEPQRLTYDASSESVLGWTPDGKIAYGSRAGNFTTFQQRLWYIDPKGGLPIRTPIAEITDASFMPDGRTIIYSRVNAYTYNWRGYRGGQQGKISLYDFEKNAYSELPAGREQSYFPMAIGRSVYYISDKNQPTLNLYRYDLDSRRETQLTRYTDADIRMPSTDGKSIVWERDGFLYVYNIASGAAARQSPQILTENLSVRPALKQLGNQLSSISISPSGTRVMAEARGEIFSIPAKTGDTRNLTRTSNARERFAKWSPDGQKIAYLSDASGNWEVYTQPQLGGEATQITQANGKIAFNDLGWSPNSKFLELRTSSKDLYILNVETRELTKVLKALFKVGSSDWSPDSNWLAATVIGANRLASIYLYEVATGRLTKATQGNYSDYSVAFDLNGKYLYLISTRTFTPSQGQFDMKLETADRIYAIPLASDTANPLQSLSEEEPNSSAKTETETNTKKEDSQKVRIDLEGLAERTFPLPMPAGIYTNIVGAKNGVIYTTRTAGSPGITLAKFDFGSRQSQNIFQGSASQLSFNPSRTHAAVYGDGRLSVIEMRPGADFAAGRVETGNVTAIIDPRQEWRQIFWEAWRFQRDNFYDANLKGVDWNAVGRRYEQYLPFAGHRSDLNYVIGLMIGELGTSHSNVSGGDFGTPAPTISVGQLGADYEVAGEFIRFKKIFYGQSFEEAWRGPLGEPGLKIREGDYLLAIDGEPVNSKVHPNALLLNKADKYVNLTINSQPTMEGARRVRVRPIAEEGTLRYRDWVETTSRYVEKMSGGRIGYIHVPDVLEEGISQFARSFYSQRDKDAMIVDERWNRGGYTNHGLVDMLNRKSAMRLQPRDAADSFDVYAIEGPKAMLINQHAGSGGDSLPFIFKRAGLGPLIGRRTLGALVALDDGLSTVDDGQVSSPQYAVYDPDTGKLIAENVGILPDIEVDMRPDLVAQGQDPQLDAAIKYLMEQLQKTPPKPRKEIAQSASAGLNKLY
jgi:tricorn protease